MAFDLGAVVAHVKADIGDFQAKMSQVSKQTKNMSDKVNDFGKKLSGTGKKLSLFASVPIVGLGLAAVKSAADMEQLEKSFTVMLGSAEKAQKLLGEIKEFAKATPFQLTDIQKGSKALLAFGIESEKIIPSLKGIGDIAAGVGIPIDELAVIYGKARTSGTLFAEDVNQLTERGVPIIAALAKQFGVAESEVKKLVSTGAVGFENLQQAFGDMTNTGGLFLDTLKINKDGFEEFLPPVKDVLTALRNSPDDAAEFITALEEMGHTEEDLESGLHELGLTQLDLFQAWEDGANDFGQFAGLMEAQMDSTGGKFSNLQDAVGELGRQFGKILLPIANELIGVLAQVAAWFGNLSEDQKKAVITIGLVVAAVGPLLLILGALISAVGSVIAAIGVISGVLSALALGPIVALAAAVALLAFLWNKNFMGIRESTQIVWEAIKSLMSKGVEFLKDIGGKIIESLTKPFSEAFEKIKDTVKKIRDKLDFTKRQSPSVVDIVENGVNKVNRALGGLQINAGLNISKPAGQASVGVSGRTGITQISINLDGAIISDEQGARRMSELLGDNIIRQLQTNVRF